MKTFKILTTTLGVVTTASLLWQSPAKAEAIDLFQPIFLQKAEQALANHKPENALKLLENRVDGLARQSFRAAGNELVCRAHFQLADYATAEASCDRAVALGGDGNSAWSYVNNRGVMRLMQGNFAGALSDFEQALKFNPRSEGAQTNAAVARRELARVEQLSQVDVW